MLLKLIFIYFSKYETIETHARKCLTLIILAIARVNMSTTKTLTDTEHKENQNHTIPAALSTLFSFCDERLCMFCQLD